MRPYLGHGQRNDVSQASEQMGNFVSLVAFPRRMSKLDRSRRVRIWGQVVPSAGTDVAWVLVHRLDTLDRSMLKSMLQWPLVNLSGWGRISYYQHLKEAVDFGAVLHSCSGT